MNPPVILVVDDQEDNRRILQVMLTHAGYRTHSVARAYDAIRLLSEVEPDLILLDLMMPGLDGWGAIQAFRHHAVTARTPVMAVTARDGQGLQERLREAGFCAYLKKPFYPKEALDAVERCLEGMGKGEPWIELPHYESLRPPTL